MIEIFVGIVVGNLIAEDVTLAGCIALGTRVFRDGPRADIRQAFSRNFSSICLPFLLNGFIGCSKW